MKNAKKLLCLMLCACFALTLLVGCKKSDEKESETTVTTNQQGNETDDLHDANGYLKDSLPEKDFEGKKFSIYSWQEQKHIDWGKGEPSDNIVEQALYQRQLNLKERFNVELDLIYAKGSWEDRYSFVSGLEQVITSGDNAYQAVCQYTATAGIGAMKGFYKDLNDVDNIDFAKPWWPRYLNSTAAVGDKLFFASGDITGTAIKNLHCMYVNLDMFRDLGLSSSVDGRTIFQVVEDGDWTLETLKSLAIDTVGHDEDSNKDIYGLTMANGPTADALYYGAGFRTIDNKGGDMFLSEDLNSTTLSDWFDVVQDLYCSHPDVVVEDGHFYKGNSLFYNGGLSSVMSDLRDVDFEYSILPMVKMDKEQDSYYTTPNLWVSMFSIPICANDFNESGFMLEALASEGYRTVSDEIYYDAFQSRYLPTDNNAKMFDIICDNVVYDSARMFADDLGMFAAFRMGVNDISQSWGSIKAGSYDVWKKNIEKIANTLKAFD